MTPEVVQALIESTAASAAASTQVSETLRAMHAGMGELRDGQVSHSSELVALTIAQTERNRLLRQLVTVLASKPAIAGFALGALLVAAGLAPLVIGRASLSNYLPAQHTVADHAEP